ncbi:MAG TPA: phosphoglycerate kinase [Geminicoccus sp.]|uniref:phosphoglycerate kinase n=1 Tax=Geminicoccus sp. TaxID=2024832 RepID=UPI002CEAF1A2|nr:phosphoglycerate kinase [Geminicoccus sp.]HWL67346.1 phosphoglycerate kinase [Geminicoccus sp.]
MARFETIDQFDPKGKRVLVRVDFNVPMQDGEITDATRIERAAVTLKELMGKGARVIALSHFGRPKGKVEPAMSLEPIARALGKALGGIDVVFGKDCVGPEAEAAVAKVGEGGIALLENLRFHAGEEKNQKEFADALAALGDVYVNDAFSASHRAHASVTGLAERLPAYAGRLMEAELKALGAAVGDADRPVAALIGGAKVSTKLDVLGHLLDKVDVLIIGGGMANTFLFADGVEIGKSLCEKDLAGNAREIAAKAKARNVRIVLPVDAVVATRFEANAPHRVTGLDSVEPEEMILDVGPESVAAVEEALARCKTLLWNGPMGAFEVAPFDQGTNAVARAAARLTREGRLQSVAGGGDTVAALAHAGVLEEFSYVSTAGGAFLEFIEGKDLPGVAALAR